MLKSIKPILALSLLASVSVFAQDSIVDCTSPSGTIFVVGHGEVKASPDTAKLNYVITETSEDAKKACDTVEKKVSLFYQNLKRIPNFSEKYFISEGITVSPSYRYEKDKTVFEGYKAYRRVTVTTSDFSLISKINEAAFDASISNIESYYYEISDLKAYQVKADSLAMKDANDKAQRLAQGFNLKLLKPCSVRFGNNNITPRPLMMMRSNANYDRQNDALNVENRPNEQIISSYIEAEFAIE